MARYLMAALAEDGWTGSLVAGSLGSPGEDTHARTFFEGLDVVDVDYTPSRTAYEAGGDVFSVADPMHPSYEDRADVPDQLLAAVAPQHAAQLAESWSQPFARAIDDRTEVAHLHHLTAQLDAVTTRWPQIPVLAHLHGTELKFIEAVDERAEIAHRLGETLDTMGQAEGDADLDLDLGQLDDGQRKVLASTRWSQWRFGEHWRNHLVRQARQADHLVTVSPSDRVTAIRLLGVAPSQVTAIATGVDTHRFHPADLERHRRRALFRRWLVEDPHGWDTSGRPGSMAYTDADLDRLLGPDGDNPVFIYVGRFTEAKRVPLMIRAFARARDRSARPISLLIWGGHPGEWEGEHPVDVAHEVGGDGIFFAGWRGHDDLPEGLAAADALVMASVNDSFPGTALEAMATGLPVLATLSGGFPTMVNLDPSELTGWLVPPDDLEALAAALVHVADDPNGLAQRGRSAHRHAVANLSWTSQVPLFEAAYAEAMDAQRLETV